MNEQTDRVAAGFGARLREERKGLGLNQTQFAELGGVQRISQSQYENDATPPTLRYLAAIGAAGVDIYYLLFGVRIPFARLSPAKQDDIERKAFDLLEDYVQHQCGGRLSGDGRFVLFKLIRSHLTQVEPNTTQSAPNLVQLLSEKLSYGRTGTA